MLDIYKKKESLVSPAGFNLKCLLLSLQWFAVNLKFLFFVKF